MTPAELITGDRHRGGHRPAAIRDGLSAAVGRGLARWAADPRPRAAASGVVPETTHRRPWVPVMADRRPGRRDDVVTRTTTDRELLREFLERDRLFAAYAICDLEDARVPPDALGRRLGRRRRWWPSSSSTAGSTPQPLFVMGGPTASAAILRDLIRPRAAYVAARPETLPPVEALYRVDPGPPMVRMWVDRAHFRPCPARRSRGCCRWTSAT